MMMERSLFCDRSVEYVQVDTIKDRLKSEKHQQRKDMKWRAPEDHLPYQKCYSYRGEKQLLLKHLEYVHSGNHSNAYFCKLRPFSAEAENHWVYEHVR